MRPVASKIDRRRVARISPTISRYVINFRDYSLRREDLGGLWATADDGWRREWLRRGIVPLDYPTPWRRIGLSYYESWRSGQSRRGTSRPAQLSASDGGNTQRSGRAFIVQSPAWTACWRSRGWASRPR